jgi:hypothetical protein
MAFHAKLSPSSAHRWMNCAGSVRLIGDESSTAGIEAMRGTAAHRVIELMLQNGERDANAYHNFNILVHGPGTEETLVLAPDGTFGVAEGWHHFVCDDTMVAGIQMMLDEVDRVIEESFDPTLYTERFLDMTWLDSRLGGTADVTVVDPGWVHLLDYKNGRIIVEVKGNEQMKNYAVGLLHEHPDARGVTVHLVQPNAIHEDGHIREESYSADELKIFELQMKSAADATAKPNAPRRAGDWCTFCPAKIRCPEFDAIALSEAGADFASDPAEMPVPAPEAVTDFLEDDGGEAYRATLARKRKWIPVLDQWAKDIQQAIFNELMNNREVPGTKLVQGKTNRAYVSDEATTAAALIEAGLPADELYSEPKLKSPAQVEKVRPPGMKPAAVKKIVAPLCHKPPGRITVADADDPREAVDPALAASSDFADDVGEDFG